MGHFGSFGRISVRVSANFDMGRRDFGEGWFKLCRTVGSFNGLPFQCVFGMGSAGLAKFSSSFGLSGVFSGVEVSCRDFGWDLRNPGSDLISSA